MFKIVQNGIKIHFSIFYKITYYWKLHICVYYILKLIQLELILYQVIL